MKSVSIVWCLLLTRSLTWQVYGQVFQELPILNVAANRIITSTQPTECTAYCDSRQAPCNNSPCNFTCPWGKFGSAQTISLSTENVSGCKQLTANQGFPSPGNVYQGYVFSNSSCRVEKVVNVKGSFAIGFQIIANLTCQKKDCRIQVMRVLDNSTGRTLIDIEITHNEIVVNLPGQNTHTVSTNFSNWYHLTVQYTHSSITVVKNRSFREGPDHAVSFTHIGNIVTKLKVMVGISSDLGAGRLAINNLRLLNEAVAERALLGLSTGVPSLRIGPECQCPSTHLVEEEKSCIVFPNEAKIDRLNPDAHYLGYANDDDITTTWISPRGQNTSTFRINLQGLRQVVNVTIKFDTTIPKKVAVQLGNLITSKTVTSPSTDVTLAWDLNGHETDRQTYLKTVANVVIVKLTGHQKGDPWNYHSVKEIDVMGRTACHGSPSRDLKGPNYGCRCFGNTMGQFCNNCMAGFYHRNGLFCNKQCNCDDIGASRQTCDKDTGKCLCKRNVGGDKCDRCVPFSYGLNATGCVECNCDQRGSSGCHMDTGECQCKDGVDGEICDTCKTNFYGLSTSGCLPCACNSEGSNPRTCDKTSGQCDCKANIAGRMCSECSDGYWGFPTCSPCPRCNPLGRKKGTVCDKITGKCICQGEGGNTNCDPSLETEISPNYGPLAGGTVVTIRGQFLGDGIGFNVFLNDIKQISVSRNQTMITFQTLSAKNENAVWKIKLDLSPNGGGTVFLQSTFKYRPDPVVTGISNSDVLASGGLTLSVKGRNMDSVFKPILLVYLPDGESRNTTTQVCVVKSPSELTCPTPNLDSFYSGGRQEFSLGLQFDGLIDYVTINSELGLLTIVPNPVIEPWDKERNYSYPFNNAIDITGGNFTQGPVQSDYNVLIGSTDCPIRVFSDRKITCEPQIDVNKESTLTVMVKVGNFEAKVGSIRFVPFYKNIIFIGSLSGLGGLIICILIIAIVVHKRRRRQTFDQDKTNKNSKVEENRGPDHYSSTDDPTETQPRKNDRPYEPFLLTNSETTPRDPPTARVSPVSNPVPEAPDVPRSLPKPQASQTISPPQPPPPPPIKTTDANIPPLLPKKSSNTHNKSTLFSKLHSKKTDTQTKAGSLFERLDIHTQDSIWELLLDHKDVTLGKLCTKKGVMSRLIDGEFNKDSKIYPGQKLTIKTFVKPIKENSEIPDWAKKALIKANCFHGIGDHENILKLFGVTFDMTKAYILYPNMTNRTLKDYLVNIKNDIRGVEMLDFAHQIAKGMEFLASCVIKHKDLATRNCMVSTDLVVKITDSSLSDDLYQNEYSYDADKGEYYPLRWMALESLSHRFYDTKSDVWSFGVLMWELFTRGALPYFDIEESRVFSNLQTGSRLGKPEPMSEELDVLMGSCWNEDSSTRPTFNDIVLTLNKMRMASPRDSWPGLDDEEGDAIYGNIPTGIKPISSVKRY